MSRFLLDVSLLFILQFRLPVSDPVLLQAKKFLGRLLAVIRYRRMATNQVILDTLPILDFRGIVQVFSVTLDFLF